MQTEKKEKKESAFITQKAVVVSRIYRPRIVTNAVVKLRRVKTSGDRYANFFLDSRLARLGVL